VTLLSGKDSLVRLLVPAILFAVCVSAEAQQHAIPRIGYLSPLSPSSDNRLESFRGGLRELGYIEGTNIGIEYRYTRGNADRAMKAAAELAALNVDVMVAAGGDILIRAAQNASGTIPIIMMGQGSDPVAAGFVKSLAHPGGNITGLTSLTTELTGKRLELFKLAVSKITRLAFIYDASLPSSAPELKEVQTAADALKMTVQSFKVIDAPELNKVLGEMSKQPPDGLYANMAGAVINADEKKIVAFALKNRVPSMYSNKSAVEVGGLMSYAPDLTDRYRRVAYYVAKILKGAKPDDLPIEQPTKFELVINLKTAKQIGLTIPPNVLARADRVIK
jgi:ABC-type uncharacterized transport system substrate-binding protein